MKICTARFVAQYDGERTVIEEGERVEDGHELVARFPQHFRTRSLDEELEIRSARIQELQRDDADRQLRDDAAKSPRVQAARAEDQFWANVDRLLHPADTRTYAERQQAEQDMRDLDFLAELDQRRESAQSAEIRRMWGGRMPADER